MDKSIALKLWEEKYGNREYVYDYAAQKIVKEDFENEASSYSWTVDFIKPLISGGLNQSQNMMICSALTKKLRADKSSFRIANAFFEVRKGKKFGTFSLFDVTDRNHPFDVLNVTEDMLSDEYHLRRQAELYGRDKRERFVLPDLGNIRKNVFEKNAPEIISEEKEELVTPVEVVEEVKPAVEEPAPVIEDVTTIETTEPVENTPVVEEAAETPVLEETSEPVEETVAVSDVAPTETIEVVENEPVVEEVTETPVLDETTVSVEEGTPVADNVTPIETTEITENTPVVEEITEAAALENVSESVEEKADTPTIVPLYDDEERKIDERDVLFDTMKKETFYADDLRARYHSSLGENAKKDQTISTLASNCNALKDSLNYLNNKIASMQSMIDEYKAEKESLENTKKETEKSNEEVIQSLNQENASLKSELGKQYNDYELLQAQYQEIYAKCSAFEQEKSEWETLKETDVKKDELLLAKENEKEELNRQISELNDVIAKKTMEIENLGRQLSELRDSVQSKSDDYLSLHTDYDYLVGQKADYEQKLLVNETEKAQLKTEKENLQSKIDSLLTEKTMDEERFRNVSVENDELRAQMEKEKEDSIQKETEKEDEYQKLNQQYEELKKEKETLSASMIAISAEKDSILADKENFYEKAVQLNVRLNESEASVDKLSAENDSLKKELEENEISHKEAIDALMKQKAEADGKILFLTCGGDIERYPDYLFYLSDTDKKNTKETILEALSLYPSWHRKDEQHVSALVEGKEDAGTNIALIQERDVSYLAGEKKNREKAMSYWASKYGDIDQTTDFAGRVINRNYYLDKDNSQGWSYIKVNSSDREYDGNIVVANMRTLLDYKETGGFKSNGQSFKVVEDNGMYSIESEDYVTDPYNLEKTLRITKENLDKKTPIIYLFVKVLGNSSTTPDSKKLLEFYDLLDRTVKRTCSRSFIEMKIVPGDGNYAFLTFDGSIDGAYKEALDYALLLNSYRNEFRKEEDGINAVIILDQVEIPYSYRHFGFEQMLFLTKDVEMRAVSYELIKTAVVNTTIKRTIHLGPSIIDNLPLDQSTLKDSNIGQSRSFSDIYNFKDKFYTYNFVFNLNKKSNEDNNN